MLALSYQVICRGRLTIKQEVGGGGRRGQDRAWRDYYALLSGTSIKFYKDKKEAFFVSCSATCLMAVALMCVHVCV